MLILNLREISQYSNFKTESVYHPQAKATYTLISFHKHIPNISNHKIHARVLGDSVSHFSSKQMIFHARCWWSHIILFLGPRSKHSFYFYRRTSCIVMLSIYCHRCKEILIFLRQYPLHKSIKLEALLDILQSL